MVERGEKPPNIREINDHPPNPNQAISNLTLAPRPKPWEVTQPANSSSSSSSFAPPPPFINRSSSSTSQTNGVSYQSNDDSALFHGGNKRTPQSLRSKVKIASEHHQMVDRSLIRFITSGFLLSFRPLHIQKQL